jgi:hypothetical protein
MCVPFDPNTSQGDLTPAKPAMSRVFHENIPLHLMLQAKAAPQDRAFLFFTWHVTRAPKFQFGSSCNECAMMGGFVPAGGIGMIEHEIWGNGQKTNELVIIDGWMPGGGGAGVPKRRRCVPRPSGGVSQSPSV